MGSPSGFLGESPEEVFGAFKIQEEEGDDQVVTLVTQNVFKAIFFISFDLIYLLSFQPTFLINYLAAPIT